MTAFSNHRCPYCRKPTDQSVWMKLCASGAEFFGWKCLECKRWTPAKDGALWIAKTVLVSAGVDLSRLPVEQAESPRCVRCGTRGAEEHHWAPRAIFGRDIADLWPKDYLCKDCHDEWHRVVTPSLVQKKAS
jgi:hypothetical protein